MSGDGPILLCFDGSEVSARAIARAGELLGGGRALVCHAWVGLSRVMLHGGGNFMPATFAPAVEELDRADGEAAERLATEGARLALAAGFEAEPLPAKEENNTWRTLLGEAERHDARLVAVGAHGLSGARRLLLGSVSSAVVAHSRIPVLVVPTGAPSAAGDGPMLLCYDGSDSAKRAIGEAGDLVRRRPGGGSQRLGVVGARGPGAGAGQPRGAEHGPRPRRDRRNASERVSEEGRATAQTAGFDARSVSRSTEAPVWRALLDIADEENASMTVVGSRGLTGISAALGSVSYGVVHHSATPVLVVPAASEG
jgi:nucleotide-binding universal stress UspA family protein